MFFGAYNHSIDDKGRVIMPSKFRARLEDGVVMVEWLEGCIAVFPKDAFERLSEKVDSIPEGKLEKRDLERTIYGEAYDAVPDRQGRIMIHPSHRDYAALERDVTVAGVRNHVEIWDRGRWEESRAKRKSKYEETAEKLSEIGF